MSKLNFTIRNISKETALEVVKKYHYSNTLPKINRYFLGFYLEDKLVGVVTLGLGTRPLDTIKRIFPSLGTSDYLEIGRMVMVPGMPSNSSSQMLSQLIHWLKMNHPEIRVLVSWAAGMQGKVGYVYQSSNFLYAGCSRGEFYMKEGIIIHPRQIRGLIVPKGATEKRIGVRPTLEQMREFGLDYYIGKQFRYLYFLCDQKEKKRLMEECACKEDLALPAPKEKDLAWKKRNLTTGKLEPCGKPPYITDFNYANKGIVDIEP